MSIKYKSQPLDFIVYKDGAQGEQGKSVESSTRYYTLYKPTDEHPKPSTPTAEPDYLKTHDQFSETITSDIEVKWSKTPPEYRDEEKELKYYESTITVYDDKSWQWSEPILQTILDIDFIKSIAITTDQLYALEAKVNDINVVDTSGQTIFRANGLEHRVDVGGFNVVSNKLSAGYGSGAIALQTSSDSREYVDAEYIIADGKQYIDTGLVFDFTTDKIEITVKNTKPNPTNADGQMIVGAWPPSNGDDNGYAAILYMYGYSNIQFYGLGVDGEQKSINTNIVGNDLNKHTYVLDSINNTLTVDYTPQTVNFKINELKKVASNKTTYICAGNNSNPNWFWHGQVYGCKIWRNGNLIRLYKPVFKNGVFGLYDVVNSTFHPSASGKNFNGKIVETSASILTKNGKAYQRLDYIQNNSKNNYIDTGIYLDYSKGFSIEATFAITGQTTDESRGCIASNYLGNYDKGHISIEIVDNQSRFYAQRGDFDDRRTLTVGEKTKSIYSYNNKVISHSVVSYDANRAEKDFSSAGQMDKSLLIFIDQQKRFDPSDFKVPVKLYEMEIYSGGTLIAHFLPFLEVSSNKPGLLNLVNGQFLSQKEGDNFEYQALTAGYTFNDTENNTYRIVEYIESSNVTETTTTNDQGESVISYAQNGNYQRIDTGLPAVNITAIEVDCENLTPFSVYGALPGYNYTANKEYPGGYFYYGDGSNKQGAITQNKRMIIRQDETRCYRDGTLVYTYPTDLRLGEDTRFTEGPLYLFARYQNGNASDAGNCRIYYFKAWSGSDLVGNFIPVLKNETEYGFYDTAKNKFLGNSGSGQLLGKNFTNEDFAAIYIGADSPELAPFSVSNTGKLIATAGSIGGLNISENALFGYTSSTIESVDNENNSINQRVNGQIKISPVEIALSGNKEGEEATSRISIDPINGFRVKNLDDTPFMVDLDGKLMATSGTIGDWKIQNGSLTSDNVLLHKNGIDIAHGGKLSVGYGLKLSLADNDGGGYGWDTAIYNTVGRNFYIYQGKYPQGTSTDRPELMKSGFHLGYDGGSTEDVYINLTVKKTERDKFRVKVTLSNSSGNTWTHVNNGITYKTLWYDINVTLYARIHHRRAILSDYWETITRNITIAAGDIGVETTIDLSDWSSGKSDSGFTLECDYGDVSWNRSDCIYFKGGTTSGSGSVVYSKGHTHSIGGINFVKIYADQIHHNGTVYHDSTAVHGSDLNIKNNIATIATNYKYDTLFDSLHPVSFKFNENSSNRTHFGLIAQELKQSILDAGLTTQDVAAYCEWSQEAKSATCGIRYGELIPLNIDQIQKLKKRVSEQETTIKLLEERIKALEEKIK